MRHGRYERRTSTAVRGRRKPVRRRKLNKLFLVMLSIVLMLSILGGATVAYIIARDESVQNSFIPAEVSCRVNDGFTVTNTGNVDAYIRAAVVVNWVNSNGDIRGIAPVKGTDYYITFDSNVWSESGGYYYYKAVVPFDVNDTTSPVCTVTPKNVPPEGFSLVAEVVAEAIQADGMGANSARDAWDKAQNGN